MHEKIFIFQQNYLKLDSLQNTFMARTDWFLHMLHHKY